MIADKRRRGWTTSGLPVQRAERAGGRWVCTPHRQQGDCPFVHALDTVRGAAVCIGIPWPWTGARVWNAPLPPPRTLSIAVDGRRDVLDTRTSELLRS